jgi:tetratricopeptide (TPR) repeat protein
MLASAILVSSCVQIQAGQQVADPVWPFQSEQKMDEAIKKYASNPLATYYVIKRAWEIHKAAEATLVYRSLLMAKPDDPYLQSAYGFCQSMAYSAISSDFSNASPSPAIDKVRGLQMEAGLYRDKAYAAKPNDPYILLERGVYLAYAFADYVTPARVCLRKAVGQAPKWADAHLWYANSLTENSTIEGNTIELNTDAIQEYKRAAELDPKLTSQSLLGESSAYSLLHQYSTAVNCIDQAISVDPKEANNPGVLRMRKAFVKLE